MEGLRTWEMNQDIKVKSQVFRDSVVKNQKNNLARIGFSRFFTIYKRGNEN